MSHWTIDRSINLTIDWHYTMAWFPALLSKAHRCLSRCMTTMNVWFVYERRRCATKVKISHALATLNFNNFIVYGQKHKVLVLVFVVRTSGTFWDQNWADLLKSSVLQQNHIVYSNSIQETKVFYQKGWVIKQLFHACLLYSQTITPRYRGRPDALLH